MCHVDATSCPYRRYTDGQCHVELFFVQSLNDVAHDVVPPKTDVDLPKDDTCTMLCQQTFEWFWYKEGVHLDVSSNADVFLDISNDVVVFLETSSWTRLYFYLLSRGRYRLLLDVL